MSKRFGVGAGYASSRSAGLPAFLSSIPVVDDGGPSDTFPAHANLLGDAGMSVSEGITHLLAAVREGEEGSLDRLFDVAYGELKRRAHFQLAGSSPTLDTTALVHEAYLKLTSAAAPQWDDRTHFFRVAARAMRQILIDRARRHLAQKRGAGAVRVSLDDMQHGAPNPDTAAETLMALDDALSRLAQQSPRLAQVVELRFFGGLSVAETAETLGVADRTVKRDWRLARAFLHESLSPDGSPA